MARYASKTEAIVYLIFFCRFDLFDFLTSFVYISTTQGEGTFTAVSRSLPSPKNDEGKLAFDQTRLLLSKASDLIFHLKRASIVFLSMMFAELPLSHSAYKPNGLATLLKSTAMLNTLQYFIIRYCNLPYNTRKEEFLDGVTTTAIDRYVGVLRKKKKVEAIEFEHIDSFPIFVKVCPKKRAVFFITYCFLLCVKSTGQAFVLGHSVFKDQHTMADNIRVITACVGRSLLAKLTPSAKEQAVAAKKQIPPRPSLVLLGKILLSLNEDQLKAICSDVESLSAIGDATRDERKTKKKPEPMDEDEDVTEVIIIEYFSCLSNFSFVF